MYCAYLNTLLWDPGQATCVMSPRVHLLRERPSIHGNINQVLLELDKVCGGLHFVYCSIIVSVYYKKGGPSAVVRAVSLSHQVVGSKQPLRRFCGGKACLGLSLPQTPLMWEPPALGLPFLFD